jgi:tRNA threonylcarbamoyladenosine biosynthesis protein TsaB
LDVHGRKAVDWLKRIGHATAGGEAVNAGFCALARTRAAPFRGVDPMASLSELLRAHPRLLVLDAASSRVQAGWLETGAPARWTASDEEAGVGVFRGVAALAADPAAADAFVFCDGPGSVLGVRTVAMALRTWNVLKPRPCYAYHSLAIVAHTLEDAEIRVIADARRDSWHCQARGGTLQRVPAAELAGPLAMPEGFRHWTPLPAQTVRVPYSLAEIFPRMPHADVFRPVTEPDAFLHEEPSYATWSPQIHRAP